MGCFSWLACDSRRSISNKYSSRGSFPVYVLIPKEFGGGHIEEKEYEGYGRFGGHDVYALVARWNKPELCNGDDEHDRMVGIDIACYDDQNRFLKYPIKIAERSDAVYENEYSSDGCPHQGYYYNDDEDDDWED